MMALFWSLAALMSAAAAALLLWPLWRRGAPGVSRRETNVAIYRERVAELRADAEAGRVPADEARSLEAELGRRLLGEADPAAAVEASERRASRPWRISAFLAAAVPALAFGLYLAGGDWRLAGPGPPSLDYLTRRLEQRVAQAPENAGAWVLLGRAREAGGNYAGAARAYARANKLVQPPRADMLVLEAQARALAQDGRLNGAPARLFRAALERDPDNGRALWYAGLAAEQAGDGARARRLWQRLAAQELPDAFRKLLEARLAALPQKKR